MRAGSGIGDPVPSKVTVMSAAVLFCAFAGDNIPALMQNAAKMTMFNVRSLKEHIVSLS
jgi:hypothetical protein